MADFEQIISSPTAAYEEGLAFFRGQGVLNRTLLRITADLERNGIDYAVIAAVARAATQPEPIIPPGTIPSRPRVA